MDDFADATQLRDPLRGVTLGDYLVVRSIGEGGMGLVYEGLHVTLNKRVAIKVIRPEQAQDPVMMRRVLAEAQAVAAVRHRGIVDIHAHGVTPDGRPYLVMEFLEGEPLDAFLVREGTPIPPRLAGELLVLACGPLAAAHRAGVVHRDLKPSNFFVCMDDGERYLKLLDFGLAKRAAPGKAASTFTSASLIVGTPEYMAPEQARAQATDARTDVYSLGVMAFELFAGRLPYSAPTTVDVVMKHLTAPVPLLAQQVPGLPPALSELVARMMAKEPAERPSSVEVVRAELKRLLPELPSERVRGTLASRDAASEDAGTDATYQRLEAASAPAVEASAPAIEPAVDDAAPPRSSRGLWLGLTGLLALLVGGLVVLLMPAHPVAADERTDEGAESVPVVPVAPTEPERLDVADAAVVANVALPEQPVASGPAAAAVVLDSGVAAPGARKVPSRAELLARVERLERAAHVGNDASALVLLKVYRERCERAATEQERLSVSRSLDELQRTHRLR